MLPKDLKELLFAFNAHEVKYLVVGGYAVGMHAEPRATKDLDVLIRADRDNAERVYRALASYGAPLAGTRSEDFYTDPGSVYQIGQPPLRIDILQQIDGVTFDECWPDHDEVLIDDVSVHVISAAHLVQNKLASHSLQDLADVEALREAMKRR